MSDEFDDDGTWDDSLLAQVEHIEQQARSNPALARGGARTAAPAQTDHASRPPDDRRWIAGKTTAMAADARQAASVAGQTRAAPIDLDAATSMVQKTLFGHVAPTVAPRASTSKVPPWGPSGGLTDSQKVRAVHTKRWDQTQYAKSAALSKAKKAAAPKSRSKGKGKARSYDDGEEDGEDIEFSDNDYHDADDQGNPPALKLVPDREACKTWIYPLNKPLRKYQFDIIAKALYTNTLVALPTGLGKTFLAAVLMLNYYRWFPKGKIIFMAPSRPLVTQQIAACHGIAGLPLDDAVELTGTSHQNKRAIEWAKRRIFYCTPQTVQNDLKAGALEPSEVICLVVDEAHKATGDYGE